MSHSEFIRNAIAKNPEATCAEVLAAALAEGMTILSGSYYQTKRKLGGAVPTPGRRGRPRKDGTQAATTPVATPAVEHKPVRVAKSATNVATGDTCSVETAAKIIKAVSATGLDLVTAHRALGDVIKFGVTA